jgi:hypothetical protein
VPAYSNPSTREGGREGGKREGGREGGRKERRKEGRKEGRQAAIGPMLQNVPAGSAVSILAIAAPQATEEPQWKTAAPIPCSLTLLPIHGQRQERIFQTVMDKGQYWPAG